MNLVTRFLQFIEANGSNVTHKKECRNHIIPILKLLKKYFLFKDDEHASELDKRGAQCKAIQDFYSITDEELDECDLLGPLVKGAHCLGNGF